MSVPARVQEKGNLKQPASAPKGKLHTAKWLGIFGGTFLVYAIVCWITSFVLDQPSGAAIKNALTTEDRAIGPLKVERANQVYDIEVKNPTIGNDQWSYVSGELLNEDQEPLMSFGKEQWAEAGYDDEGHWSESDTGYTMKLTVPKPGTYYFDFNVESSQPENDDIQVTITPKANSVLAHQVLALFSAILGAVLLAAALFCMNAEFTDSGSTNDDDDDD
jgi:hypothetical protein